MITIIKEWKAVNFSLDNLEKHLRTTYPTYLGNSAHKHLELYFSSELSDVDKAAIDAHYDALDGSDYISKADIEAQEKTLEDAVNAAKLVILTKTWDQLSVVEKKIAMNMPVTKQEMGL